MPFSDLLRLTVLLCAGEATALGAFTVAVAAPRDDTTTLLVAGGWWLVALVLGLFLGRPSVAADGVREALAQARTVTSIPEESPGRVAVARLWPIGLSALVAGGIGIVFPGVPAIGSGYALLVALAWRHRERAVLAVEVRDGVRFLVEPGSALQPLRLVRTPGLTRER